ncbi:hypothetical protein NHF40_09085 [Maricaulaceae bacterium EIL42A08]|nr:hypothetical protein [Maricaulaceae bacterium EIL42A08]MCP2679949.1 hypothetical protein [Maricaulaceae bacterium NA33B04]
MTKDTDEPVFKPVKPQDRAARTHAAAMEIIDAEADARQSKTERLRAARLKMEAEQGPPEPATKPRATPKRTKFIKV